MAGPVDGQPGEQRVVSVDDYRGPVGACGSCEHGCPARAHEPGTVAEPERRDRISAGSQPDGDVASGEGAKCALEAVVRRGDELSRVAPRDDDDRRARPHAAPVSPHELERCLMPPSPKRGAVDQHGVRRCRVGADRPSVDSERDCGDVRHRHRCFSTDGRPPAYRVGSDNAKQWLRRPTPSGWVRGKQTQPAGGKGEKSSHDTEYAPEPSAADRNAAGTVALCSDDTPPPNGVLA